MLQIYLIIHFFGMTNCMSQMTFISKKVCIFSTLSSTKLNNINECAILCSKKNCEVFLYDDTTWTCSFYLAKDTCQSENFCKFVKAFFNFNIPDNLTAPDTARYKILKNINFQYGIGYTSVFNIINDTNTEILIIGLAGGIQAASGKYGKNKLIIWITEDLIINMNKRSSEFELIANNIVTYLTSGQCIWYYNCYYSIDDYNNFIGITNLVFGVISSSIFDFNDFYNKSIIYQWHVIVARVKSSNAPTKWMKDLLAMFGYCVASVYGNQDWIINDNICQPVNPVAFACL